MYYGHYNDRGKYIGFYIKEVHGDSIPEPYIILNDEQHAQAITGEYGVVEGKHTKGFIEEKFDIESFRKERNLLLQESDWTQLVDSPLSEEKKLEWKEYRQKLRDATQSKNKDLFSIAKPE